MSKLIGKASGLRLHSGAVHNRNVCFDDGRSHDVGFTHDNREYGVLMSRTITFLILLATACFVSRVSAAGSPNIVMIISDDQAWNDYSFMGHDSIATPHLDRLASRSALFPRGYVPTALCRPSLVTLATGLYASQHGVTGNDPARPASEDSEEYNQARAALIARIDQFPTVPKLLGEIGYRSHQSGKWWEGNFRRGGFTEGMTRGFPEPGGRHGDDGLKIGREGLAPVLDFIDSSAKEQTPFFVWYAPFLPHSPHNPPERLLKKYQTRDRPAKLARYYAMCEWFDETCGTLVDHLDQKGLSENTLIVYVTDNGWIQRTEMTEVSEDWNSPFAPRSKQSPNEGGVRTPIMLCWPGRIVPEVRPEIVSSIDLVPTMLAAVAVEPPHALPGKNLLPVLAGQRPLDRDAIFGESFAHDVADVNNPQATLLYRWVIQGRWKLILTYDGEVPRLKSVHAHVERQPQLFDLLADPHEQENLAAGHPELLEELAGKIASWWPADQRKAQTSL